MSNPLERRKDSTKVDNCEKCLRRKLYSHFGSFPRHILLEEVGHPHLQLEMKLRGNIVDGKGCVAMCSKLSGVEEEELIALAKP